MHYWIIRSLQFSLMPKKSIQIADHGVKTMNFADDSIIFVKEFNCLTSIELILELWKKCSSSKILFQKVRFVGEQELGQNKSQFHKENLYLELNVTLFERK